MSDVHIAIDLSDSHCGWFEKVTQGGDIESWVAVRRTNPRRSQRLLLHRSSLQQQLAQLILSGLGFRHTLLYPHMATWHLVLRLTPICGEFSILCPLMAPHHIHMLQCIPMVAYTPIHPCLRDLILSVHLLCPRQMVSLRLLGIHLELWKQRVSLLK